MLRLLTPADTCRPLEIYPVHLGQDAISVNVSGERPQKRALHITLPATWRPPVAGNVLCSSADGMRCNRGTADAEVSRTCLLRAAPPPTAHPPPPRCCVPGAGSTAGGGPTTRGGSDTSLENNNVYGLEPKVYVEGSPAAAGKGAAMGAGGGGPEAGECDGCHH